MNLKPLGDRVIVKPAEPETVTASGIIIASKTEEKPMRGEVMAVGKGKLDNNGNLVAPDVKVGDQVVFGKYGGTEVSYEGEDFLILRGDDIFAVIQ